MTLRIRMRGRAALTTPCRLALLAALALFSACVPFASAQAISNDFVSEMSRLGSAPGWPWPVSPTTVTRGFDQLDNRYGPGHRGVDLSAQVGQPVLAPVTAVVRFSGWVVDRPVLSLTTSTGVTITLEPIESPLTAGAVIVAGELIGTVSVGGHCAGECVHLGVVVDGDYRNPLRYFGQVRQARLLPLYG